jgi:hypothetical protein
MKSKLFSVTSLLVIGAFGLGACSTFHAANGTVKTDVRPSTGIVQSYATGGGEVGPMPVPPGSVDAVTSGAAAEAQSPVVADQSVANGPADSVAPASADRMVVKTATLSITVDNTAKTVDAITQLADEFGGFVVSLNTSKTTYGPQAQVAEQASMVIRVPSARLNEALAKLKGMAVETNNEAVQGQDVTSEYTDLQSRLTNLEAAEKQLQSIMAEATKTEDVMVVYNQLVATRGEIEQIKGQMKYYEQSAAMSAISLTITPNVVTQPIEVGGWHPEGAAKQAIEDTVRFLQETTDGLIYFAIARLPFLIIVGIPALLIGRWAWRRTRKSPAKPAAAPAAGTD